MSESFDGLVRVQQIDPVGMVTIRGDLTDAAFREAVGGAVGPIPDTRRINGGASGGLAWMSPDELMLFCPAADAPAAAVGLADRLARQHHLAVDVSDARAVFRLTGAAVRDVLAKGAPVDLAPGRFEPGEIRRTRLGQVAVAFWLTDAETAELVCFRSVADFVAEWLRIAAATDAPVGFHAL
ncbi:sarcosine oxidase subunit gamma [Pontivivens ytuae]|uniref:Sarcosine oxidase subunit gamma n=1 Tax=Pontivivens ytuae TaxID=2789856 RepID=A0A7S9QCH9_9RHOB|nr:sarcosine oxidase subunit gamma family protein [Pontivivens ytuae]QPH53121.1 sarcosine oxidase subunit gamma [Pontivivens ytuae]